MYGNINYKIVQREIVAINLKFLVSSLLQNGFFLFLILSKIISYNAQKGIINTNTSVC